jgi:hypothetical protein
MKALGAGCHSISSFGAFNGVLRGVASGEDFAALAIDTCSIGRTPAARDKVPDYNLSNSRNLRHL